MRLRTPGKTGLLLALGGAAGLFMFALAGSPGPARAACSNPTGYAGDQMYNATHKVMQYCNAANKWIPMWGNSTGGPGSGCTPELSLRDSVTSSTFLNELIDMDFSADGNYLYTIATWTDTLSGFNVSDPANITQVDDFVDAVNLNHATAIATKGNHVMVGLYDDSTINSFTVANGNIVGQSDTVNHAGFHGVFDMDVVGNNMYVSGVVNGRLTVVDVTDPGNMTVLGSITDPDLNAAAGIAISGSYAYVAATGAASLTVVNISNPASMSVAGSSTGTEMATPYDVALSGNYAFVTGGSSNSVTAFDISNPAAPTEVGNIVDAVNLNFVARIVIRGDHAYVGMANGDNIAAIDISDPANMSIVDTYSDTDTDYIRAIAITNDKFFVGAFGGDTLFSLDTGCTSGGGTPTPSECENDGGKVVGGACWFLGATGDTCATVCSTQNGYNAATLSYAGSGGSDANCDAVLDALGVPAGAMTATSNAAGCQARASLNSRRRGTNPTTDTSVPYFQHQRACACNRDVTPGVGGGGGSGEALYATDTYTGNGATQNISNGLNLTAGGLTLIKRLASGTVIATYDTLRGALNTLDLSIDDATDPADADTMTAFNADGFSIGDDSRVNQNGTSMVAWSFKEAPGFLDVVQYTGNGGTSQVVNHNLGVAPGFVLIKERDENSNWLAWHRSNPDGFYVFNENDAFENSPANVVQTVSTTGIRVSNGDFDAGDTLNENNHVYIAYIFAHDPSGNIQCGTYTGNGNVNGPVVTLGWEPEWLLIKDINSAGTSSGWSIIDSKRSQTVVVGTANQTNPSITWLDWAQSTGFEVATNHASVNNNGDTFAYCAIKKGASTGGGGGGGPPLSDKEQSCADSGGTWSAGSDACWFLSTPGESCDDACGDVFGLYNDVTLSYAGSAGTNGNCQTILDALGAPGSGAPTTQAVAYGCHVNGTTRRRGTTATTDIAETTGVVRACACKVGGDDLGDHTATQAINMNNNRIVNLGAPSANTDIATKGYVDSLTGTNETDPQVGTLTVDKWCAVSGTTINCNEDEPSGGGTLSGQQEPESVVVVYQKQSGVDGGTPGATGSWHNYPFNVIRQNSAGAFLMDNGVQLPAGTYYVDAAITFVGVGQFATALHQGGTRLVGGLSGNVNSSAPDSNIAYVRGMFTLGSTATVQLRYRIGNAMANVGLGAASSDGTEIYGTMYIEKLN